MTNDMKSNDASQWKKVLKDSIMIMQVIIIAEGQMLIYQVRGNDNKKLRPNGSGEHRKTMLKHNNYASI